METFAVASGRPLMPLLRLLPPAFCMNILSGKSAPPVSSAKQDAFRKTCKLNSSTTGQSPSCSIPTRHFEREKRYDSFSAGLTTWSEFRADPGEWASGPPQPQRETAGGIAVVRLYVQCASAGARQQW